MTDPDLHSLNLTSITGITAATMFGVEVVKRTLKDVKRFQNIPVWAYALAISILLSIFANKVIKTSDGTPVLSGDLWKIMWAAGLSAVSSSGFYTWLKNPEPVLTASTSSTPVDKGDIVIGAKSLIVFLALFMMGCAACPEKAILRDGMDQGTATIRANEEAWANLLTIDPATGKDNRDKLPSLTTTQRDQNTATLRAYENLVATDRANK